MGQCFPVESPPPPVEHPFESKRSVALSPKPFAVATRSATQDQEHQRLSKVFDVFANQAPSRLVPVLHAIAPLVAWIVIIFQVAWPYIVNFVLTVHSYYIRMPTELVHAILGACLCFFGGTFPTLIAASEAARLCGWDRTKQALEDLAVEAAAVVKHNKKDDAVDNDKDGIADVNRLSGKELIARKTKLVLQNCNPDKINTALGGLATSCIAIVAVLKVEFAQTVALAVSLGDTIQKPMLSLLAPTAVHLVPQTYRQWIPIVIGWTAKSIGMFFAWYIQRVLSAVHSGMRGGLLCTRSLMALARKYNTNPSLGIFAIDPEETMIDEVAGGLLAALGIWWQWSFNFSIPFPFDLLTWPLLLGENYLQWYVTHS